MSVLEKQISDLKTKIKEAWQLLDMNSVKNKIVDFEKKMSALDFWNNQDNARKISQQTSDLKCQVEIWETLKKEIEEIEEIEAVANTENDESVLKDLATKFTELEKKYQKLELQILLSGEHDVSNAIVSIYAGAGGIDAMDWAGILMRMFARFVESRNWKLEILDESPGEEAGYKSITFAVRGRFAYGYLKSEAGVHRLVRISPFDAEKMSHTSFALVEVMPKLDDISDTKIIIDPKDIRIDTFMSSGKGGQSVNTTYSAVRITHTPTNTVVCCQNERSQLQNKETAMRVLKSRLFQRMQEERAEELDELKGKHKSPQWGNQIRSYVLHPYQMVKDHRTNEETQDIQSVLDGDLEKFMEAFLRSQVNN